MNMRKMAASILGLSVGLSLLGTNVAWANTASMALPPRPHRPSRALMAPARHFQPPKFTWADMGYPTQPSASTLEDTGSSTQPSASTLEETGSSTQPSASASADTGSSTQPSASASADTGSSS